MKNVAASSLVIGLEGLGLTQADEGRLKHPAVGGVILFARNYESPAQLKKLCESVKSIRPDLQIVVDQEGGRVQRFKEGFSALPAARAFGDIYDKSPVEALSVARQTGQLMASELRACGVDVSLAPVVDLGVNQEVIGSRAFHRDPNIVAVLAGAFIAGMNTAGMPAVIKHFPGHGSARGDTHLNEVRDEREFAALLAQDLVPFQALIQKKVWGIMASHVIYPDVDDQPASFSKIWLTKILRERLKFKGVIWSDDLGMQAAQRFKSPLKAVKAAMDAGCDKILLCNDFAVIDVVLGR